MPLFSRTTRRQVTLDDVTVRDFSGGWNVIDQDLNLSTSFAKRLVNLERRPDGSIGLRQGTRLIFDTAGVEDTDIINTFYFNNHWINVHESGTITAVDGANNVRIIWNDDFAGALPGTPVGWGTTSFVSAAVFRNELIVCNGTDKPLKIAPNPLFVDYLQDLATLSNVNTPVARYVVTNNRFLILCGDLTDLGVAHISNQDTSGTHVGDPAPNNATTIRLDTSVNEGSAEIRGVASFGSRVVFAFDNALVPVQLNVFNDSGDHVPDINDPINSYGSFSHRTIQDLGDDVLFCDITGTPSLRRAVLTSTLRPERPSQLIDPEIQTQVASLPLISLEDDVFSVYNRLDGQYMLFVPDSPSFAQRQETRGYVFTSIPALKVQAWSEIRGWDWQCAAVSQQGRVLFCKGTQGFLYLRDSDGITNGGDFVGDQETFDDDTAFTDHTGWTPIADESDSGIPIDFEWELPWADFSDRGKIKHIKYLGIDAVGDADFTVDLFVDELLEDPNDNGQDWLDGTTFTDGTGFQRGYLFRELSPALSAEFIAGEVGGFGKSNFGTRAFGVPRDSSNPHLVAWPAKAKVTKIRVHGCTRRRLNMVGFTIYYIKGQVRRK